MSPQSSLEHSEAPRESTRSVLLVRPSALGDVCRSVPVLASLGRAFPSARIDWLVQPEFVDAIRAHPTLNEAVDFPRSRFARWWFPPRTFEFLRWVRTFRHRYDLVVDCQGLFRSGLVTRATGAPIRIGDRNAREFAWLGYNRRHVVDGHAHSVDRWLALIASEGIEPIPDTRLYLSDEDRHWHRAQSLGDRYAVIAPTSRWGSKRWPIDRWSKVLPSLADHGIEAVVLVGAPGEQEQTATLRQGSSSSPMSMIDMTGRTTVGQMMSLLNGASIVLSCDSAAMHMTVGFDRPLVALFGPTDPSYVGPYGRPDAVIRAPGATGHVSHRHHDDSTMSRITHTAVIQRVNEVLDAEGSSSR